MTNPIPEQKCRRCGHAFCESTSMYEECTPEPGSISICVECGLIQLFDDKLMLRDPTPEEWSEISCQPRIIELGILRASVRESDYKKNYRPNGWKRPRYWK